MATTKPATFLGGPEFGSRIEAAPRGPGLRVRFAALDSTDKSVLKRPLYLPAVLGDFTIREESAASTIDTVSGGQFTTVPAGSLSARQLRSLDIEALTLDWNPAWLVESGLDPDDVRDELQTLLRLKRKGEFEFLAMLKLGRGRPEELRMHALVTALERTLKHGEPNARYYTMTVAEAKFASTTRRSVSKPGPKLPTTHKLIATDTLLSLAKKYHGRYDTWESIRDANAISTRWGQSEPLVKMHRYKVGSKVKIPEPPPEPGPIRRHH